MRSRFSVWVRVRAKGWLILVLVAVLVGFAFATLPIAADASGDVVGLDTRMFYSPDEAFEVVASYSSDGRRTLRWFYLSADLVNPLLYMSILALMISWLFERGFRSGSFIQELNLVPVGAAVFDVVENVGVVSMISVYPEQPAALVWMAVAGTTGKYVFLYASFALVLIGLFAGVRRKVVGDFVTR